ncbi:MAG TPA: TraR/DksA family transcriptional regulator [Acidimicrobiales bacterium]|jgi:RNA polymerase-binding transcription factor DksA|nr:TraR/DksA family transcriptional regulator [Acidimicrobiales bacterium]
MPELFQIQSEVLASERTRLLAQLDEIGFGPNGSLTYDTNFADSSQVTAERGEAERLAADLQESLDDVDRALERLAEGTYGVCERCGNPISEARHEAMPTARRCLDCAKLP